MSQQDTVQNNGEDQVDTDKPSNAVNEPTQDLTEDQVCFLLEELMKDSANSSIAEDVMANLNKSTEVSIPQKALGSETKP